MSIRHFFAGTISLLCLMSLVQGDDRVSVRIDAGESQVTRDNTDRIEQALRSATECHFNNESLEKAITLLGQRHHIETWLDKQALFDEGVAADQQVTLVKSGISLDAALDLLLDPLGLTFDNQHGVLQISTISKASQTMSTRIYPVSDLVGTNYKFLSRLIMDNTSGKWFTIDQEGGVITPFPQSRSIIIRQTRKVHGEIEGLIVGLRRSKTMQFGSHPTSATDLSRLNSVQSSIKIRPTPRSQQWPAVPVSQPTRNWSAGG